MLRLIWIYQLLHDFVWNINNKFSVRYIYILFYLGWNFILSPRSFWNVGPNIISIKYGPILLGTKSSKTRHFLAHLSTTCSGWAVVIDQCPASVRRCVCPSMNNYLKNLLWNRPTDFNETLQKWSLVDALSEDFKDLNSVKNSGCHGNQKKKL